MKEKATKEENKYDFSEKHRGKSRKSRRKKAQSERNIRICALGFLNKILERHHIFKASNQKFFEGHSSYKKKE